MEVETYRCSNGHKFSSRKDPDAKLVKDKPQCPVCGKRVIKKSTKS